MSGGTAATESGIGFLKRAAWALRNIFGRTNKER
jgi:hypothetical protein